MSFESGAQVAIAFAAEYPERVDRLVIHNGRVGRSTRPQADELAPDAPELVEGIREDDGSLDRLGIEPGQNLFESNPSLAKYPDQVSQVLKFEQTAGSRAAQKRQLLSIWDIDIVEIAPRVEAPTLIIHSAGNRVHHVGYARYLAQLIPNASLLELPGDDQMYWISDNWKDYVDAGITFVTDADVEASVERKFAVVMFTDIVRSTESSADIGDSEWRNRLDLHDRVSAKVVAEHQGEVIKHTGDGILATFEMPSSAIDAAVELQSQLSAAEIAIRVGLHAGEVEVRGSDISGTTVNLAARTQQAAPDGLIYTSTAIRQMLLGSQYSFDNAGTHTFKGLDEPQEVWQVGQTGDA
jgi:class 3 adenylate cyclase